MTSMPDTKDRWKLISIVTIFIALISIMLNVYFYLSDESEIVPSADNETNCSTILNTSDKNEMEMHRIARVIITPGDTIVID